MGFLYGDSSESKLEFNYLALVREVVDVAVALVDHEAHLTSAGERRRQREKESSAAIEELEDLGRETMALYAPIFKEQGDSALGRCAKQIATAARDAITTEIASAKAALAADLDAQDKEDQKRWLKSFAALEKLLKAHELPDAMKSFEVTLDGKAKAFVVQRTSYGVEASLGIDVPHASLLAANELLIEKIVPDAEVSSLEAGGWIKKSDKLVPYRIGKYAVTKVSVGAGVLVTARDAGGAGFDLAMRDGDVTVERIGEKDGRSFTIDDRNRGGLKTLCEKLEAAVRALGDSKALSSVSIDGASLAEYPHPQVVAERLIAAIAPTVNEISRHGQNPNELVLRKMIDADDGRREEIFVKKSDLLKKIEPLPEAGKKIFAALHLRPGPTSVPTPPPPTHRQTTTGIPPFRPLPVTRPSKPAIDLDDVPEIIDFESVGGTLSDLVDPTAIDGLLAKHDPDASAKFEAALDAAVESPPIGGVIAESTSKATKRAALIIASHDDDDDDAAEIEVIGGDDDDDGEAETLERRVEPPRSDAKSSDAKSSEPPRSGAKSSEPPRSGAKSSEPHAKSAESLKSFDAKIRAKSSGESNEASGETSDAKRDVTRSGGATRASTAPPVKSDAAVKPDPSAKGGKSDAAATKSEAKSDAAAKSDTAATKSDAAASAAKGSAGKSDAKSRAETAVGDGNEIDDALDKLTDDIPSTRAKSAPVTN